MLRLSHLMIWDLERLKNCYSGNIECFCPFGKVMKCFGKKEGKSSNWYEETPRYQCLIEKKCDSLKFKDYTAML